MTSGSRLLDNVWPHLWHWEGDCCVWHGNHMGSITRRPAVMWFGKKRAVTRIIIEERDGPMEPSLMACHKPPCVNKSCVRPGHLYSGTNSDNMMDQPSEVRSEKARKAGIASGVARK